MEYGVVNKSKIVLFNSVQTKRNTDNPFSIGTDLFPPLPMYIMTKRSEAYFINDYGIWILKKGNHKQMELIQNIYELFLKKKFQILYNQNVQKIQLGQKILKFNNIIVDFFSFEDSFYPSVLNSDSMKIIKALR